MTRKSQYRLGEKGAEISDLLDEIESLLERTKVLYEQYFMGIQKVAPGQLHRDIERKIRDLTQLQIRNTALRYRLNTVTQKFGVYNNYWRRVLRQIEQGTYIRDVARVSRQAARRGEDVPEEILIAMPKRMRDRILRDREILARQAERRAGVGEDAPDLDAVPEDPIEQGAEAVAQEPVPKKPRSSVHSLGAAFLDDDLDTDIDALFSALTSEAEKAVDAHTRPRPAPAAPERPPVAPVPAGPEPASPAPQTRPSQPLPRPPAAGPAPAGAPSVPADAAARPVRPPLKPSVPPPLSPGQAARPSVPPAQPRPSALPPGMNEDNARDLYRKYIAARKQVGESTDVSYDKLMDSLRKQAPKVLQQHNASGVEFDVVVKDDKVLLKAKPKR